jgi:signal transduction protein with GAF and PtsI domain
MLLSLQEHGVSHSGAVSREEFGRAVLDCACRLMKCDRGSVMMWEEREGCLKIVAARSVVPERTQKLFLKPGEGVAGKAFVSGQPIFIADPAADPRYVAPAAGDVEPFVSIPLMVKGKPIGVLNLHAKEDAEPFSDYNVKFLGILAGESAVMLHNMDLFDSLQTFYLEMVQTLARAVDSKDAYTHEHSDRARVKARKVALELGLPDQMVRYVEYAALLHDIGKIGIDEAILLKPGKLTPEEYEQMKKHPIIGHQILAPVKYLGPVAQMVLYHQEWFDGRGYPEGLKGEEIPLGSRIVAVLDAWDAMTSDRPYRKALGREIAVGELKKGAGTQFDPKVVDTFLRLESAEWSLEAPKES